MRWPAGLRLSRLQIGGLALLVGGNMALSIFLLFPPAFVAVNIPPDARRSAPVLAHIAQVMLLAAWLAWSDLFAPVRWIVAAAFLVIQFWATKLCAASISKDSPDGIHEIYLIFIAVLFATHAIALPLRWLYGWRLTFRDAVVTESRRGQFTFRQWLAWCVAIALPLAIAAGLPGEDRTGFLIAIGVTVMIVAPIMMSAFVAAFSRRWRLWSPLAIVCACAMGLTLFEIFWQVLLSRGQGFPGAQTSLLVLCLGGAPMVSVMFLLNVLLLRMLGMRWVSVPCPAT